MQQNDTYKLGRAVVGVIAVALSTLAHGQPASVGAVIQPAAKLPAPASAIAMPAGQVVMPAVVTAAAADSGSGTLRRIEQLQREAAEAELRNKARGGSGSGSPLIPMGIGAGTGPLPGFGQAPVFPASVPTVSPGALPPFAGDQTQPAMPVVKIADPSPADTAKAELALYQTLAVLLVNGKYKAEVSRDGVIRSIAIGSDIESWKVSRIDLDGVVVERKVSVEGKKKRKEEMTISARLQNFKEGAATVVASTSSMIAPSTPPASIGKAGMPDSTNVQVLRPVSPSSRQ